MNEKQEKSLNRIAKTYRRTFDELGVFEDKAFGTPTLYFRWSEPNDRTVFGYVLANGNWHISEEQKGAFADD